MLPFLTVWYIILCTRRLQPTRDDCNVRVQWFSSVISTSILSASLHNSFGSSLFSFAILIDFSLTVKAATLIFVSGCGSAISSAKQGKSGSIYNLMKN